MTPANVVAPRRARVPDLPCALPRRAADDLRGVLRPARARVRPRGDRRRRVPRRGGGGAGVDVALPAVAAGRSRPGAGRPRRRVHAAAPSRQPRRAARPGAPVDQGRLGQSVELLQGPRGERRDHDGARVRVRGDQLRLDRQPRQRHRGARGQGRHALLRLRARRPRAREDPRDRGLRRQGRHREGELRRGEPAVLRGRRGAAVGVRQREHAPVLRGGVEVARVRDRRTARLAPARITSWCRSRAARCSRRCTARSRS